MITRIIVMEIKNEALKLNNEQFKIISFSILLYFVCNFLTIVNSQCCLKYQGEICISCPPNTHLYRGNCILNRANCIQYAAGFDCIACRFGYVLDTNSSTCVAGDLGQVVIPTNGFLPVPFQFYSSNLAKKILATIKDNFKSLNDLTISKIFVRNVGQTPMNKIPAQTDERYYRVILMSATGFLQVVFAYIPPKNPPTTQTTEQLNLVLSKNYQVGPNQQFLNLEGDPQSAKVKQQIRSKFPQVSTLQILDTFRSLGTQITQGKVLPVFIYRVFLINENTGLVQLNISLPFAQPKQGQQLNISKLPQKIENLLIQIAENPSMLKNFENTVLKSVTLSDNNGYQVYNATYQHNDLSINGRPAQSYFIVNVDPNSNRVVVGDLYLYKINPNPTTNGGVNSNKTNQNNGGGQNPPNTTIALDNTTKTAKPPVRVINLPANKSPTMRMVSNDLPFTEYIDILKFIQTSTFQAVRNFQIKFYPDIVSGNDIKRVAVAQNQTMYVFFIVYRIYSIQQINAYFTFALIKQTYNLQLLRLFRTVQANRTLIQFNDNNRVQQLNALDQSTKDIISLYITNDPRYSPSALISQILISKFNQTQNPNQTEEKTVTYYQIKYYYPGELNKQYQYIQFRAQIVAGNLSTRRKLGNILFPKQKLIQVADTDIITQQSIDFYINNTVFGGDQTVNYKKISISQSIDRPNIFRVSLQVFNKFVVMYQIDTSLMILPIPRLMSNKTITAVSNATNQTSPTNGTTQVNGTFIDSSNVGSSVTKTQVIINNFPQKNVTPTAAPIDNTKNSTDPTLLSQNDIKKFIADFLKIQIDTVTNVKIIKRETLQKLLDTYTVQFTLKNTANLRGSNLAANVPKTFVFQISNKPATPTKPSNMDQNKRPRGNDNKAYSYKGFNWLDPFGLFSMFNEKHNYNSQTIFLDPFGVIDTSTTILQSIFHLPFTLLGIPTNPPPNIAEAGKNTQAIKTFIQQIPTIIPLRLTENNKVMNLNQLSLLPVEKVKAEATNLLNKKITTPLIYDKNIATVQTQRQIGNDRKLSLLGIQHLYYGNIGVLASITEESIPDVQYLDNGYLLSLTDTTIVEKVPDVSNIHNVISTQISKALTASNYTQDQITKNVSQKDIKCWKFKRITNVDQMQFTYQFDGFIVKAGILVGRKIDNNNDSNVTDATITKMKAIGNKWNKIKQQKSKHSSIRSITIKSAFRVAERVLWSLYGNYLYDGQIQDVKMENTGGVIIFTVRYAIPSGVIDVKLQYNLSTKKGYVLEIRSVNASNPQLMPKGCKKLQGAGLGMKCVECVSTHYLNTKDDACYEKIKDCELQSGQLCLSCSKGFISTPDFKCK